MACLKAGVGNLYKSKKTKGPRIDPCGIPWLILLQCEVVLQYLFLEFINILLYLSCKQDLSKV